MKFNTLKQGFLAKHPNGSIEKCSEIINSGYDTGVLVRFSEHGREYRYTDTHEGIAKRLGIPSPSPLEGNVTGFESVIEINNKNTPVVDVYLARRGYEREIKAVNGRPVKSVQWVGITHRWTSLGRCSFGRFALEF